jgi:hypothetical protein
VTSLSIDGLTITELTPKGKFAVWASVVSALFLSQIAYNIGEFPVTTEFACYALIALYLLVSGYASVRPFTLILYLVAAACAVLTMKLTTSSASWTSLLLLFALYAPFSFRLSRQQDLEPIQQYLQSAYVSAATVIAGIAIVQLVLVNATKADALTNIYFLLPESIRGGGTYTFLREGGGIIKANGFFLRESADLSIVTGLALIIEYFSKARWRVLGILTAGLFCSLSGTGLLALAVGLLMPRSLNRVPVFLASSLVFVLMLFVLSNSQIPGLNLFFDRLYEFETPGTSGYARFVAPMDLVRLNLDTGGTTMWLGNGAGSFFRTVPLLGIAYEISDPTWAKLIFEYGFIGFALIFAIFVSRVYSSGLRAEMCNYILFVWISTAEVLKVELILLVWLLTLVPQADRRSKRTNFSVVPGIQ